MTGECNLFLILSIDEPKPGSRLAPMITDLVRAVRCTNVYFFEFLDRPPEDLIFKRLITLGLYPVPMHPGDPNFIPRRYLEDASEMFSGFSYELSYGNLVEGSLPTLPRGASRVRKLVHGGIGQIYTFCRDEKLFEYIITGKSRS